MKGSQYARLEILRTLRSRRYLLFSLAFPLILFFAVAGPNRHAHIDGIPFPLYYMTGMAAWGTMVAVVSSGARIAGERQVGWTRQLRITPLKASAYFRAKVLCGYLMALFSIAALCLAGTALGVRLSAGEWLSMIGLLLVGLVPFAALGILFGHAVKVDSLGPALGGTTSLFALLGGAYGPIATGGLFLSVVKCLPSYWLVQAAKSALGASGWPPAEAWIVIAAWTVAFVVLARSRLPARHGAGLRLGPDTVGGHGPRSDVGRPGGARVGSHPAQVDAGMAQGRLPRGLSRLPRPGRRWRRPVLQGPRRCCRLFGYCGLLRWLSLRRCPRPGEPTRGATGISTRFSSLFLSANCSLPARTHLSCACSSSWSPSPASAGGRRRS